MDMGRNIYRLALMVLAVVGALTTYTFLGLVFDDISVQAMVQWRGDWPFDITMRGAGVADIEAEVRQLTGVVHVERALLVDVIIGQGMSSLLTPGPSSLLELELSEGIAPRTFEEIALPKTVAESLGLRVGDMLNLIPIGSTTIHRLVVSGILASKTGVPPMPVITEEGSRRLSTINTDVILVNLDGKVNLHRTRDALAVLAPRAEIRMRDLHYEGVQQGMGLSETIVSAVRLLVLCVTLCSVAALFFLMQRERAYQYGVFRAMGLKRFWLLVPPLLEGLLVMTIGFLVSALLVYPAAGMVGVVKPFDTLLQELFTQARQFTLLSVGLTLALTLFLAHQPIIDLLRDPWGKG